MPITVNETEQMRDYRLEALDETYPMPKRESYASDDEYRQALLNTYRGLRQEEYQYTVLNECTKTYNLVRDGNNAGVNENTGMFNSYRNYINAHGISAAEKERRRKQVANCAMSRSGEMAGICMSNSPTGTQNSKFNSCAICASANVAQISSQMGYDGNDNLMIAEYRGRNITLRNNIATPEGMCRTDSVPQQCRTGVEPIRRRGAQPQKKTLNQMVADGSIGVGDAVSLHTGPATNTSTGYHAVTIAAVHRDATGKVTSYTIQSANGCHLQEIDVKNNSSYYGKMPVASAVATHTWIDGKINDEVNARQNMTTEQLEAEVAAARTRTQGVVSDLQQTEAYGCQRNYGRTNYYAEMQNGYKRDLADGKRKHDARMARLQEENQTPVPDATEQQTTVPQPEQMVTPTPDASHDVAAAQLRVQKGEIGNSPEAEIKSGPMYKGTSTHDATRVLQETDERTPETAIREDNQQAHTTAAAAAEKPAELRFQNGKLVVVKKAPARTSVRTPTTPVAKQDSVQEQPKPEPRNAPKMTVEQMAAVLKKRREQSQQ